MCTCTFDMSISLNCSLRSPLLHVDFLCAFVQLNMHGTLYMHHRSKLFMSTCLVNCQSHTAHHVNMSHEYRIYPNKSRAHINTWAQINAGVQQSKVNRCLYKTRKRLINAWSIIVYRK